MRFAAALLLVGCSAVPPDPAIGTWLCAERWLGAARAECPVDGASWQLDLGPEGAVFIEAFIDPAIEPVIVPLDTVPLEHGPIIRRPEPCCCCSGCCSGRRA